MSAQIVALRKAGSKRNVTSSPKGRKKNTAYRVHEPDRGPDGQAPPRPDRDQIRTGAGVTAGKQGDLVSKTDQLFGQPRDNPLGSSIELGRHAFSKRRHLRDPHQLPACHLGELIGWATRLLRSI